MTSTEILDDGSDQWRPGPELPYGISGAALISDPSGGVVLIGGSPYLKTILRLSHAGLEAEWELLPKKLKTGRQHHVAFLVPDDVVDCNE